MKKSYIIKVKDKDYNYHADALLVKLRFDPKIWLELNLTKERLRRGFYYMRFKNSSEANSYLAIFSKGILYRGKDFTIRDKKTVGINDYKYMGLIFNVLIKQKIRPKKIWIEYLNDYDEILYVKFKNLQDKAQFVLLYSV